MRVNSEGRSWTWDGSGMQAAAHEFNYQAARRRLPAMAALSGHLSGVSCRVRVVVTLGCNVNQLHYHKLLLAYVSAPPRMPLEAQEQVGEYTVNARMEHDIN